MSLLLIFFSMWKGCLAHKICSALVVIGALNWGLVGAFDFSLVNKIFGSVNWLERLVYILVGLSGLMLIVGCRCKQCKACCNTAEAKKM